MLSLMPRIRALYSVFPGGGRSGWWVREMREARGVEVGGGRIWRSKVEEEVK